MRSHEYAGSGAGHIAGATWSHYNSLNVATVAESWKFK